MADSSDEEQRGSSGTQVASPPLDPQRIRLRAWQLAQDGEHGDPSGFECGVILRDLNYKIFKLFLLSVLWRASVSRDQFFSKVELGPHESRIRTFLKMGSDPTSEEYSAILILPLGQPFANVMLRPWRSRIDGVWFYHLYFPNVIVLVKVDQRPTPAPFDKIQLRPNGDNYFVFQPHQGTAEDHFYRGLHEFMRKNNLFEKADLQ